MANATTIARPYVKAILSLASVNRSYAKWSQMLDFLSVLVSDPLAQGVLRNHIISSAVKADFINSVAEDSLTDEGKNLVKILAYNRRLLIMPALFALYEVLRKQEEHEVSVKLFVAQDLSIDFMRQLQSSFTAKIGGTVSVESELEPALIGGGKLKIGDRVLDVTIKGRLKELYKHLTQ